MGAKNSESCLIEFQSVGEVSEVILISKLEPHLFVFLTLKLKVGTIKIMS